MYQIENECLRLEVRAQGAELQALSRRAGGESLLWDGGPAWQWRAPVCFPWCGRIRDQYYEEDGVRYPGLIHGFLRDMPHEVKAQAPEEITLHAAANAETLALFPWQFAADTTHRLEENRVVTEVTITNTDTRPFPMQLGFHTALRCPFAGGGAEDYQFRFQRAEEALEAVCDGGFRTGALRPVFTGQSVVPVRREMFDHDSILLTGLTSQWVQLEERETGRYLRMDIEGYPDVLLWSPPGIPGFLCIEPWHGSPAMVTGAHTLWDRPDAITLAPGERFTARQVLTVGWEQ